MAYERGTGSVEVELSRLQSWTETADVDLYGRNGDIGVIREHRNEQAERVATDRFYRKMVTLMGVFGSLGGIVAIIELLKIFHFIPK